MPAPTRDRGENRGRGDSFKGLSERTPAVEKCGDGALGSRVSKGESFESSRQVQLDACAVAVEAESDDGGQRMGSSGPAKERDVVEKKDDSEVITTGRSIAVETTEPWTGQPVESPALVDGLPRGGMPQCDGGQNHSGDERSQPGPAMLCSERDDEVQGGGSEAVLRGARPHATADGVGELGLGEQRQGSRRLPTANGNYILGQLQGQDVIYTVDPGATETLIASRFYRQIPEAVRPKLWGGTEGTAIGAGEEGLPIKIWGSAMFDLQLGPVKLQRELAVADIRDEVLLGDDILRRDEEGPMDILNSKRVLLFNGQKIPLTCVGGPKKAIRLSTINNEIIPGMTERVIDVFVERPDEAYDEAVERSLLLEADPDFQEKFGCMVTPVMVQTAKRVSTHARVFNPFSSPVMIEAEAVVGNLVPVDGAKVLKKAEHPKERGNSHCCRRVVIEKPKLPARRGMVRRMQQMEGKPAPSAVKVPDYLEALAERSTEGWSESQQWAIRNLLVDYKDVFSKDKNDLGKTNLVEHTIDTGEAKPVAYPPRRVPLAFAEEEKKEIKRMLEQGIVRPSTSPWASPLCLVRKPNGDPRVCIDYRGLNAKTVPIQQPIPRAEDCINSLAGSAVFSVGDGTSAYYQVPMKKEDVPKTAFTSKYGLLECVYMPMGLKSAGATFQRLMEIALAGLQWVSCVIYLDDVIVYGKDFDEHMTRLEEVLQRFRSAGLKLKPSKCFFFQRQVKFLGHLISAKGVQPDPGNIEKIVNWPVPKNVTQVRAFLGMGNYYRRFIRDYSKKMRPLIELTRDGVAFEWTPECEMAFNILKKSLTSSEVMALPTDQGQYVLDTDASQDTIGATLSQVQDGKERVIAYGSRTLSKTERNYCVTDRELLAVRYFMEYYKQYLLGPNEFLVRTDHQALKWLFSLKDPKDRIARWIEAMSPFVFVIEYRPGTKHGNADSMSRRCAHPFECRCPVLEDEEILKCGPCAKCKRRAVLMDSSLMTAEGTLQLDYLSPCEGNLDLAEGDKLLPVIRRCIEGHSRIVIRRCTGTTTKTRRRRLGQVGRRRRYRKTKPYGPVTRRAANARRRKLTKRAAKARLRMLRQARVLDKDSPSTTNQYKQKLRSYQQKRTTGHGASSDGGAGSEESDDSSDSDALADRTPEPTKLKSNFWALPKLADLRIRQLKDPDLVPIIRAKEEGKRPSAKDIPGMSPATRHYWLYWDALFLYSGVLFRKFARKDGTGHYIQFVVPRTLKDTILYQMHECVASGHLGQKKTRERLLRRFYWFKVREDANLWVQRCDTCAAIKKPPKEIRAPMGTMIAGAPMDRVATDVLGPLPETPRGNQFILSMGDSFTKWADMFPTPDQTAQTTAFCLLREVCMKLGFPIELHSDQGRNYESRIMAELCELLEIRKTRTSAANPRGNGQVERLNRTIIRMIKAYLRGEQTEWDLYLGCLAGAYRGTIHESTGLTPNLMMLAREIETPIEIMVGVHQHESYRSYGEFVAKLKLKMQHAHGYSSGAHGQCSQTLQKICMTQK